MVGSGKIINKKPISTIVRTTFFMENKERSFTNPICKCRIELM